ANRPATGCSRIRRRWPATPGRPARVGHWHRQSWEIGASDQQILRHAGAFLLHPYGGIIPLPSGRLVVVIIVDSQTSGQRVDLDLAGLALLGSHRLEEAALAYDQDVRIAIGLQLLPHQLFRHRLVTRNE